MNKKLKRKIVIAAAIALVLFILAGLDMRLKVVHYKFNGNVNIKIAHISDLHGCYYGKNMKTLVDAINKENPDMIVYTGDIFDDKVPYKNSITFIDQTSQYLSYYVNGNHEYWSNDLDNIRRILNEHGVIILDDKTAHLSINENNINISGIEDPEAGKGLSKQLRSLNLRENAYFKNPYNILLAHRPENIDEYLKYDFDLILTGHAHGGQWRIPYLLNGLFAPHQGLFPKYAGGAYKMGNTNFVVSRGLARESTLVPRFYNRPELVIIEISKDVE